MGKDDAYRELKDAWFNVLQTKDGRRVVWDLLENCKVMATGMTGDNWTFYWVGKQDVGRYITGKVVETRKSSLVEMMNEAEERNGR